MSRTLRTNSQLWTQFLSVNKRKDNLQSRVGRKMKKNLLKRISKINSLFKNFDIFLDIKLIIQESKAHEDYSKAANVIPATIVTSPSKTRSRSVSPAKIPGWFCVTVLHVFYSQLISDDIFFLNEPTRNCQRHWLNFSMILTGSVEPSKNIEKISHIPFQGYFERGFQKRCTLI